MRLASNGGAHETALLDFAITIEQFSGHRVYRTSCEAMTQLLDDQGAGALGLIETITLFVVVVAWQFQGGVWAAWPDFLPRILTTSSLP